MTDQPTVHADDSVRAERGGSAIKITLVGFDKPLLTAIALVLSVAAAGMCFFTEMREERRVYFTQRCEAYVEQAVFNKQPVPYAVCGPREK